MTSGRGPWLRRLGSRPVSLWVIKHLISPLDRLIVRVSRGRLPPLTSLALPTLLLTTRGRQSGEARTVPLVYIVDGDRYLVANARPPGERRNPWVLNLRAAATASIRVAGRELEVEVREMGEDETGMLWPALVAVWPALDEFYGATGERAVFSLEPLD